MVSLFLKLSTMTIDEILKVMEDNPALLHFRIVNSTGKAVANGKGFLPEDAQEQLLIAIDGLKDGHYQILLGKYSNLSEQRAAEILHFTKGNPMATVQNTGRFTAAVGFTYDDIARAKQEGYEQGQKEARLLHLEEKVRQQDLEIKEIKDGFKKLCQMLDEADGKEDGNFLGKALDFANQAQEAAGAFSSFKL